MEDELPAERITGAMVEPTTVAYFLEQPALLDAKWVAAVPAVAAAHAVPYVVEALLTLAAAVTSGVRDILAKIDSLQAQLTTLLQQILTSVLSIVKRSLDDKFTQEHSLSAAQALEATLYQLRFAEFGTDPIRAKEAILNDVSCFGTAFTKYNELNSDRDGLGIAGYVATASLQLATMRDLVNSGKSITVTRESINNLVDFHVTNLTKAVARAKAAIPETYQIAAFWYPGTPGQDPSYPPGKRTIDQIDWDAEHPMRRVPVALLKVNTLFLGIAVKDPYNPPYFWGWASNAPGALPYEPAQAWLGKSNELVRSRIPALTKALEQFRAAALKEYDELYGTVASKAMLEFNKLKG